MTAIETLGRIAEEAAATVAELERKQATAKPTTPAQKLAAARLAELDAAIALQTAQVAELKSELRVERDKSIAAHDAVIEAQKAMRLQQRAAGLVKNRVEFAAAELRDLETQRAEMTAAEEARRAHDAAPAVKWMLRPKI